MSGDDTGPWLESKKSEATRGDEWATKCPVEVEPIDGLDAYTVRITGQLLDMMGEESVFHLSRVIAIAIFKTKAERGAL